MKHVVAVFVTALALGTGAAGQPMDKDEAQIIKSRMIPYPQKVAIADGPVVRIDESLAVTITLTNRTDGVEKRAAKLFKSAFGVSPRLTF